MRVYVMSRGGPAPLPLRLGYATDASFMTVWTTISWLCTTRYRTAGADKRVRSTSLYHPSQCGIVLKPRPDGVD